MSALEASAGAAPAAALGGSADEKRPAAANQNQPSEDLEIAKLQEQNQFLHGYIARCEAQLSVYQSKMPELKASLDAQQVTFNARDLPPWIANARYAQPLLVAYEARIKELTEKSRGDAENLAALRGELDKLLKRNQALEDELEQGVKKLLHDFDAKAGTGRAAGLGAGAAEALVGVGPVGAEEIREMQERLSLLTEQNDLLRAQEQKAREDAAKMQADMEAAFHDRDVAHQRLQHMEQVQSEHDNAIAQLSIVQSQMGSVATERDTLARELRAAKELKQKQDALINQLRADIAGVKRELQMAVAREIEQATRTEQIQKQRDDAEEKNRALLQQLDGAQRDGEGMVKSIDSLEKTLQQYKSRELAVSALEGEAKNRIQEAELRRDQALAREEQLKKENERLHEKMRLHEEELKRANAANIEGMFQRNKASEEKLKEEIKSMELMCAEMQTHKDRAVREAKSLQAQLEKLTNAMSGEQRRLLTELQQTKTAAVSAQSERELMQERAERAQSELKRHQQMWEREREVLTLQYKDARGKLAAQESTLAAQREQIARLTDIANKKTQELEQYGRAFEQREKRLQDRADDAERSKALEVKDLHDKLEDAYRSLEESEERVKSLVQSQDDLANKMREELRSTVVQFQGLLREQKAQVSKLSSRNQILELRLNALSKDREESKQQDDRPFRSRLSSSTRFSQTVKGAASHRSTSPSKPYASSSSATAGGYAQLSQTAPLSRDLPLGSPRTVAKAVVSQADRAAKAHGREQALIATTGAAAADAKQPENKRGGGSARSSAGDALPASVLDRALDGELGLVDPQASMDDVLATSSGDFGIAAELLARGVATRALSSGAGSAAAHSKLSSSAQPELVPTRETSDVPTGPSEATSAREVSFSSAPAVSPSSGGTGGLGPIPPAARTLATSSRLAPLPSVRS